MKIKKYLASTSREALRQVKIELGEDAVILSNKQGKQGVEMMALAGTEMSTIVDEPTNDENDKVHQSDTPLTPTVPEKIITPSPQVNQQQEQESDDKLPSILARDVINEIQTMRHTLEDQLATISWGNFTKGQPGKMKVLRAMLGAGFSPLLSRRLVNKLSTNLNYSQSLKKAMSALAANLHTAASDEIIEKGGVYALEGPTGVGKTTTTAKLAARCVMRHGADKVALLTTDGYRIGGHEQLRIYGKLLGIPVRSIKDTEDLQLTLSELTNKHMVLIDTVGMSQRDQMVDEHIAMLNNCGTEIKRLLLLNATSSGDTLDEVIAAYQSSGIHGCIISKADEAVSLGTALDVVIRHKLILHFVADGQKVPEDIHSANTDYLLKDIFKPAPAKSPFTLQDEEFVTVMANNSQPETKIAYAGECHD